MLSEDRYRVLPIRNSPTYSGYSSGTRQAREVVQRDRVGPARPRGLASANASDYKTFVRWTVYGGDTGELECNLCEFFGPDCTDRWETHNIWDDDDTIDPRLLG